MEGWGEGVEHMLSGQCQQFGYGMTAIHQVVGGGVGSYQLLARLENELNAPFTACKLCVDVSVDSTIPPSSCTSLS